MVPSVQLARLSDPSALASLYDLVLTFDYENLNTTIDDNGRLLDKRLEASASARVTARCSTSRPTRWGGWSRAGSSSTKGGIKSSAGS